VGASTGGTQAVKHLLMGLPPNTPGIVIAQHMPALFTAQFANRLNSDCIIEVREAKSGDVVTPGVALIAPGNRHMILCRRGPHYVVEIKDGPHVRHQRPSIDVLFHSVATCAGAAAVGVLLTGMGADGARGLLAMRQAGARTFAQDEQSCVVFGMPKEAIRLGAVEKVVSIDQMSHRILDAISQKETRRPTRLDLCPT
jgi:two-component system chemotaxis response regulator CheB